MKILLLYLFLIFTISNNSFVDVHSKELIETKNLNRNNINFSKRNLTSKTELLKILDSKKNIKKFDLENDFGIIMSGFFFNKKQKNAIIISFDSNNISTLTIYRLNNNLWSEIYNQTNTKLIKENNFKIYIRDFNFDGFLDIGILNGISLGTTILSMELWLNQNNLNFIYFPYFAEIGTPLIDKKNKLIKGFEACCAFTEISFKDYFWKNDSLILKKVVSIENYQKPKIIETQFKYENNKNQITKESEYNIRQKELNKMIKIYESNWKLE